MKRVASALVLIPIIVWVVLWSPPVVVLAVTAIVACICYHEYSGIAARWGHGNARPLGYAAGLLVLAAPHQFAGAIFIGAALIALALAMAAGDLRDSLPRAALFLFGLVYIFGCWTFAPLLHARNPHWLFYALALNWIGDSAAYYAGRAWGRHRLAPRVSPKKSLEGSAASVLAAALFGWLYLGRFIPSVTAVEALLVTAGANIAGQIGDLAESAIKRGAHVKDSGTILPGHGGFLDRVDSTLFTLPAIYLYLQFR